MGTGDGGRGSGDRGQETGDGGQGEREDRRWAEDRERGSGVRQSEGDCKRRCERNLGNIGTLERKSLRARGKKILWSDSHFLAGVEQDGLCSFLAVFVEFLIG